MGGREATRALAQVEKVMPDKPHRPASSNRILSRLSREDFALLAPHLEATDLPFRECLEIRSKPIDHVYFIESGLASVVANAGSDQGMEVGLIGREGMTGLAVVMATDRTPHETFMQLEGGGRRIRAEDLRQAMARSATLHRSFLRYGHAFTLQIARTAIANGRSKIEERLARWLLMAHDRIDGDDLALTHEFLAQMLGVRRPGVTIALHELETHGLIRTSRGFISIVDRKGLEASSNGAYKPPEAESPQLPR
jgi:CRP-like cAMP-binding protein